MQMFPHFGPGQPCPICGTADDKPCTLIPVDEDETRGRENKRALCVHLDCLDLWARERGPYLIIEGSFLRLDKP